MSDFASLTLELDTTPFEESLRECEEAVNGLNASGSVESSGADGAGERIGPEVLNALNSASLTGVGATLETISGQLAEISGVLNQIAGEKTVRFELVSAV
ncbi:MAG: hypothetical protein V8T90_12770 [Victivallales bacterium]|jgi:hypothetical protein